MLYDECVFFNKYIIWGFFFIPKYMAEKKDWQINTFISCDMFHYISSGNSDCMHRLTQPCIKLTKFSFHQKKLMQFTRI